LYIEAIHAWHGQIEQCAPMHCWIVFIKKSLLRGVRFGLVADRSQKAVQCIEPALIVIDEKDREAPRASRPHNLTYFGNQIALGLAVYRQTAVMSALGQERTIVANGNPPSSALVQ